MQPSTYDLLKKNSGNSAETSDNTDDNSTHELLKKSVYTAPKKKDEETPDSGDGFADAIHAGHALSDDTSSSTEDQAASPLQSIPEVQWFPPMAAEPPKPEDFHWWDVPFSQPVKQPAGTGNTTATQPAGPHQIKQDVSGEETIAEKQQKARDILSNDLEVNAVYSPNKPVTPEAPQPDAEPTVADIFDPAGLHKQKEPLPPELKDAIKNNVLNGNGDEVIDYFNVRKNQMQTEMANLDQQQRDLTKATYRVTPKGGTEVIGRKITDQNAYDNLETQKVGLQKQLSDMEQATEQVASKNLSKKYDIADDKKQVTPFTLNSAQQDGMVMLKLKDPVSFERYQNRLSKNLPLKQDDQARLAAEGYQARLQAVAGDLDNAIAVAEPIVNQVNTQKTDLDKQKAAIDAEPNDKKKNALIEKYNAASTEFNKLLADPKMQMVTEKSKEANGLVKGFSTLTDNFPEVRREEITQALANAFYERVQMKRAALGTNPMFIDPRLAASYILNESPDDEDYKALADKFTANGVPLTAAQVKEYAEPKGGGGWGLNDPMKDNNLRVDGFLSSVSQGAYKTIMGIAKSANRWDWVNQMIFDKTGIMRTDEDVENLNDTIDKKVHDYTRTADQAQLSQPAALINITDGSQNFSRKEINKHAGDLNLTPGSITNLVGDGLAQLAIFGSAGKAGGAVAKVLTEAVPLAEIVPEALVSSTEGTLAGIDYTQNLYSNAARVAAITERTHRIGELAGNAGTFFASSYGTHWDAASKITNDKDLIRASAMANSTIDAASTLILPQVDIMKALEGERPALFSTFEKLFQAEGRQVTPALMKEYATVVMDKLVMPTKVGVEGVIRAVGEPMADQAILGKDIDWAQVRDNAKTAFVAGFISTLPVAPFVGGGMRNRSDLMEHSMYEAGVNPEKYKAYVNDQMAAGKTDEATGNRQISFINTMRDIVSRFPKTDPDGKPYSDDQKRKWAAEDFRSLYDRFQAKRTTNDAMREQFEKDAEEATNVQREILQIGGQKAEETVRSAQEQVVNTAQQVKQEVEKTPPAERTEADKEKYDVADNILSSALGKEVIDAQATADDALATALKPETAKPTTDEQIEYNDLPADVKKIVDTHGDDNDKTVFHQKLGEAGYGVTHDMESFGTESGVSFFKLPAEENLPTEEEFAKGEVPTSAFDVESRWAAGERIFKVHDMDGENPTPVLNRDELNNYTPDQLIALPPVGDVKYSPEAKKEIKLSPKENKLLTLINKGIPGPTSVLKKTIAAATKDPAQARTIFKELLDQYEGGRDIELREQLGNDIGDAIASLAKKTTYENKKGKKDEAVTVVKKRKPSKPKKEGQQYEVSELDLTEPRDIALQYFGAGGKINQSAIDELFNNKSKSKSIDTQRKAMIGLTAAAAPTINQLAHQLWEDSDNENYDTQDYRNAIEDALTSHPSAGAMAKHLLDAAVIEDVKGNLSSVESAMADDKFIQKAADAVDTMDDDVKDEITGLLEKYKNTDGTVNWHQLEIDSDGFNPDFLNLSPDATYLVDSLIANSKQEPAKEEAPAPEPKQVPVKNEWANPGKTKAQKLTKELQGKEYEGKIIQSITPSGKNYRVNFEDDTSEPLLISEIQHYLDTAVEKPLTDKDELNMELDRIGTPSVNEKLNALNEISGDRTAKIIPYNGGHIVQGYGYRIEDVIKKYTNWPVVYRLGFSYFSNYTMVNAPSLKALKAALTNEGYYYVETDKDFNIVENTQPADTAKEEVTTGLLEAGITPEEVINSPEAEAWIKEHTEEILNTPADQPIQQSLFDDFEVPTPKKKKNVKKDTKGTVPDNTGQDGTATGTDSNDEQIPEEAQVGDIQPATEDGLDENVNETEAAITATVERLTARKHLENKRIADDIAELEHQLREITGEDGTVSDVDAATEKKISELKNKIASLKEKQEAVNQRYDTLISKKLSYGTRNTGDRSVGTGTESISGGRVPGTVPGNDNKPRTGQVSPPKGNNGDQSVQQSDEGRDAAIRGERSSMAGTYGNTVTGKSNAGVIKELGGVPGKLKEREAGEPVIVPARNGNNFVIPPNIDNPASFNTSKKYDDNIAAMQALVNIIRENRNATPAEKQAIFKYVGFGGLKDVLRDPAYSYGWAESTIKYKPKVAEVWRLANELEELGLDDTLQSIKSSTSSAFFTPFSVIRGVYQGLERIGFTGGKVLDPSSGIGHFFGMMPYNMAKVSDLHGVEIDKISGHFLKQLYPDANISVTGLQNASTIPGYYDLVVSNIPFGEDRVYDPTFNKSKDATLKRSQGRIHNYFFAKAITDARPGGLIAFISSTGVMDSPDNDYMRKFISDNAEVLGVFRLPDSTFKGNANTEAVSDLIFLRKYQVGEKTKDSTIMELTTREVQHKSNGNKYDVEFNKYFDANPENILGTLQAGGQWREDDYTVVPNKATPLEEQLAKRIEATLPSQVYQQAVHEATDQEAIKRYYIENATHLREGNLTVQKGKILRVTKQNSDYDKENAIEASIPKAHAPKIEAFIKVRDAMNQLYAGEIAGFADDSLKLLRKELNNAYDKFVSKFGNFSIPKNSTLFSLDIDGYNVRGLERYDRQGNIVKADIFNKRVVNPYVRIESTDTIENAVLISLNEFGRVNLQRIQELLGKNKEEVLALSKGQIFEEPDGGFVTRNEYLSGNVKKKLKLAEQAAKVDKKFEFNVAELEQVIPADIPATDIEAKLGARWIMIDPSGKNPYDTSIFEQFAEHLFGSKTKVAYLPSSDTYRVAIQGFSPLATTKWRVGSKTGSDLMEDALHSTPPKLYKVIRDEKGKDKRVIDEEPTKAATDKFYEIRKEFADWVMKDEDRRNRLAKTYNETYNTSVKRSFEGRILTFPGYAGPTPYNYQGSGAWMILQNVGGIIDHIVGAGKTLVMIIAAMEMKRLGIAKKPMIMALKANIKQIADSFKEAYPLAKVLAPTDADFSAKNRKSLLAQIAVNDWDAVIITHDNYVSISQSPEIETEIINEELEHLNIDISSLHAEGRTEMSKSQLKGLETRKKNLTARLSSLKDVVKDVELRNFQELGIDHLFLDESQMFKNLTYTTKLSNVAGMGKAAGAKKTLQLLMGIRYLQKLHRGDKGITFLSGTPISNSIVELYLLLKYLRPSKLKELSMTTLDGWASNFATNYVDVEYSVTGSLKTKDRFREFVNMPELSMLYNEIADVRNDNNIDPPIDKPKPALINRAIEPTPAQLDFFKRLDDFARSVKNKDGQSDMYARRLGLGTLTEGQMKSYMLLCTDLGTKAAIDMRMVFPDARPTGGKLFEVANDVYKEWLDSSAYKGTQLIFCDKGTPKTGKVTLDLYDLLEDTYRIGEEDLKIIFGEDKAKARLDSVTRKLKEILDYSDDEIEEIVREAKANAASAFNVYKEIKDQLVKKGIPANEVVFIHSYNTQNQKIQLFNDVNDGKVRVVIGSTSKLGTGVNVQRLIIAMHHVDAPWRPSDMDQREGRGVRQGNEAAKQYRGNTINIYQHATKNSLDALKYQYLDIKKKFIDQLRSGTLGKRIYTENDDNVGYAEMAAALSGNHAILEKAKMEKKVLDLERQRKQFQQNNYDNAARIRNEKSSIENRKGWIENTEADQATVNANRKLDENGDRKFEIELFGKHFDKAKEAGEFYLDEFEKLHSSRVVVNKNIGKIYGLPINLRIDQLGMVHLQLQGESAYNVKPSTDPVSAALAFDRAVGGIDYNLNLYREQTKKSQALIKSLEEQQTDEWDKEPELTAARQRLVDINIELNDAANAKADPTKFPDTGEENGLNVEDPEIHYATNDNGTSIPYKIISTGDPIPVESGDFIGVQRQFTDYKQLDFTGPAHINNADDVAWLMRSLEQEQGVEHFFVVYVKPDNTYIVQHISTGGITATVADPRLFVGNAVKFGVKQMYLIHNHPSGTLAPSTPDNLYFDRIRKALPDVDIHALIMNLTSGYYAQVFSGDYSKKEHVKPREELTPLKILSFSRQVFKEGYNPPTATTPAEMAAFISARRFGKGPKTELLILNSASSITAKLSVPFEMTADNVKAITNYIFENVSDAAGTNVILFGNQNVEVNVLKAIKEKLSHADIKIYDYLQIKSNDEYSSYADEGILYEPGAQYGAANTNIQDTLEDSSSPQEKIHNALTNLAFLDIKNGKGYDEYAQRVKDKHNYDDQKVLKNAYEYAQTIYDTMMSKDQKAISALVSKIDFAPLLDNLRAYQFQETQALNSDITTFNQAVTSSLTKEEFLRKATPLYPITPFAVEGDGVVLTNNKAVATAYAQDVVNRKGAMQRDAVAAQTDLYTLTGDTPVNAGFKLYHGEYDPKTAETVEKYLQRINAADDFDESTTITNHYIDFAHPMVIDAVNQPLSSFDTAKLIADAKAQKFDAIVIKNTFDDTKAGSIPTNIAISWDPKNVKTEQEIDSSYEDEDFLKDYELKTTDSVNKFISGETIFDVFGETPEGNQEYNTIKLAQMLGDGEAMIGIAQAKFGQDVLQYAPVFLDYLKGVRWEDKAKKSVALATLINKLNEAKLDTEPQSIGRRNAIDRVLQRTYATWQTFIRDASITLNAARLLRLFRDQNLADFFTDKILEESQRKEKSALQKSEMDTKISDEVAETGGEPTVADANSSIDAATQKKAAAKAKKKQVPASDYAKKAAEKLKSIDSTNSLIEKIKNALNKDIC